MKTATWVGVTVVAVIGLTAAVWAADPLDVGSEKTAPATTETRDQHTPPNGGTVYACDIHDRNCADLHDACRGAVEDAGTAAVYECDSTDHPRATTVTRTKNGCGHWYRWMPGHRNRCGGNDCGDSDRGRRGGCC